MQFIKFSSRLTGPLVRSSIIKSTPQAKLSQLTKATLPPSLVCQCNNSLHNSNLISRKINLRLNNGFVRPFSDGQSVDKEMQVFLVEEIKAEKSNSKTVTSIPGFEVHPNGAALKLVRKYKDEKIVIRLDINGSATDGEEPDSADPENFQPGPLLSKPSFAVEIHKPNYQVLCLTCNFLEEDVPDYDENTGPVEKQTPQDVKEDLFEIEGFTVIQNKSGSEELELDESVYMGDASLIDGQLYDLLMDYLDERGIGKEFATSLIDFCTAYEHESYWYPWFQSPRATEAKTYPPRRGSHFR